VSKNLHLYEIESLYLLIHTYSPRHGDTVTINIQADYKLVHLVAIVTSRHGIVKGHQIYCNYFALCKFKLKVTKNMMSEATVTVYYVKNTQYVLQEETVIKINEYNRKQVSFY